MKYIILYKGFFSEGVIDFISKFWLSFFGVYFRNRESGWSVVGWYFFVGDFFGGGRVDFGRELVCGRFIRESVGINFCLRDGLGVGW